jgi:hypothetical protein
VKPYLPSFTKHVVPSCGFAMTLYLYDEAARTYSAAQR